MGDWKWIAKLNKTTVDWHNWVGVTTYSEYGNHELKSSWNNSVTFPHWNSHIGAHLGLTPNRYP